MRIVLVIAALLAVGVASTALVLRLAAPEPADVTDLDGRAVALDPGDIPNAAALSKQAAESTGHGRFEVPSVGLDVPLGALSTVGGVITPPGFTSVYWVRDRGVNIADSGRGTVFVVTHSLRGGGKAPGNYLIDVKAGTASVRNGSLVVVDGVRYIVTGAGPVSKPELAADEAVWADIPNRLVIITCLQTPAGSESVANMVITASRRQ